MVRGLILLCGLSAGCFAESPTVGGDGSTAADGTAAGTAATTVDDTGAGPADGGSQGGSAGSEDTASDGTQDGTDADGTTTGTGSCPGELVLAPPFDAPWQGPVVLVPEHIPCEEPWADTNVSLAAPMCACDCGLELHQACTTSYTYGSGPCGSLESFPGSDCTELSLASTDPRIQVELSPAACNAPSPVAVLPSGSARVCNSPEPLEECVPLPPAHVGPCVHATAADACPAEYPVQQDAVQAQCMCNDGCDLTPFCAQVDVRTHEESDCGDRGSTLTQGACIGLLQPPAAFGLHSATPPGCPGTVASVTQVRVCCVAG